MRSSPLSQTGWRAAVSPRRVGGEVRGPCASDVAIVLVGLTLHESQGSSSGAALSRRNRLGACRAHRSQRGARDCGVAIVPEGLATLHLYCLSVKCVSSSSQSLWRTSQSSTLSDVELLEVVVPSQSFWRTRGLPRAVESPADLCMSRIAIVLAQSSTTPRRRRELGGCRCN